MSQYPPPAPQRAAHPSLVGPTLLTAVGAAAMFILPAATGDDVGGCCVQNCCAATLAVALGVMPVIVLRRAGGHPTAGLGCLIGFCGVAIGGLAGAIFQAWFPPDQAELRAMFDQLYNEIERASEQQGRTAPASRQEVIDLGMALAPYAVVLLVAGSSLFAGLLAMTVAAVGRPRPPQAPWPHGPGPHGPGPHGPPPPQSPPQSPPQWPPPPPAPPPPQE